MEKGNPKLLVSKAITTIKYETAPFMPAIHSAWVFLARKVQFVPKTRAKRIQCSIWENFSYVLIG